MKIFFQLLLSSSLLMSQPLEKIYYTVKYNNIKVGSATLEHSLLDNQSKKIQFNLKSKKIFDLIYKLREKTTIITDSDNYSIKSINKKSRQGQNKKSYQATFDYKNLTGEINSKIIKLKNQVYDPISIIYSFRDKLLKVEDIFKYDIISKNSLKSFEMHVVKKEKIKLNSKEHDCFVIEAFQVIEDNKLKKSDELKLWISSENIPIIIEKKAKYGIIKMEINEYSKK